MKRFLQTAFALCLAASGSALLSGCGFLTPPEPEPIPPAVPEPKEGVFVPSDYNVKGIPLNVENSPTNPDYFQVTRIDSGEILWVRSVDTTPIPNSTSKRTTYGPPVVMHLAGIVIPQPGQPGAQESIKTLSDWTLGRKLTIEQDEKYPLDLQKRARVQIFFPGGENRTQQLNLNRMMVRSGYAVVDVFAPTIFDTKGWLNDEEYARTNKKGLWKLGIVLNQRQPPPVKTTTKVTIKTTTPSPAGAPSLPGSPATGPGLPGAPGMPPGSPGMPPGAPGVPGGAPTAP